MKTLLIITAVAKPPPSPDEVTPRMDYHALVDSLRASGTADIVDYAAVDRERNLGVRIARALGGRCAGLAVMAFQRRAQYDSIFSNGENVAIPLALLFKLVRRRPGHITICHRMSAAKKRPFFTLLKAHRQIDRIIFNASSQMEFARTKLGISEDRLWLTTFMADDRFFRPMPWPPNPQSWGDRTDSSDSVLSASSPAIISSAGLEWRDYPTLVAAVRDMTNVQVKLAAASPWSKKVNETAAMDLPAHVDARRYDYAGLRDLYASSTMIVVPVYETDFQAGMTTILEAMAMGKPLIATRTTGQSDWVIDGVNGLCVPPGDVEALRRAIERLLGDPQLREKLGEGARAWLMANATLDNWVANVTRALTESAARQAA